MAVFGVVGLVLAAVTVWRTRRASTRIHPRKRASTVLPDNAARRCKVSVPVRQPTPSNRQRGSGASPVQGRQCARGCLSYYRTARRANRLAQSCAIAGSCEDHDTRVVPEMICAEKLFLRGASIASSVSGPCRKIFCFLFFRNMALLRTSRLIERGVSRSSRHVERGMRWTRRRRARDSVRTTAPARTTKSCGPDTPTLVSSATRASALSLTRRSFASRGYGGQKARRTREITYKS